MSIKVSSVFAIALCVTASFSQVAPVQAEIPILNPVSQSQSAGLELAGKTKKKTKAAAPRDKRPPRVKSTPTRVGTATVAQPVIQYYSWMNAEIADAWNAGYRGQGATITVVDDFTSGNVYAGDFGTGSQALRHGEWTRMETSMISPSAATATHDFYSAQAVALDGNGLNVVNMSYSMYLKSGYSANQIGWSAQERSLIAYAKNGSAVMVKSAGNDAVAVGAANHDGNVDYLNLALVGAQSAIFVGALDHNGTVDQKANLASYSNFAGNDVAVQKQFLSVGVRGDLTGLYGTSFAAPVVSGYAAVLGSKFTAATPTQITNRLLDTARQDTINGYSADLHGRGEASITRALAPASIN